MHVIFKELRSKGIPPGIWDDGQIFIWDLNRTQAVRNIVPSSSTSWGFISLPIPKQLCSEPWLRFFFPWAWLSVVALEGPSYPCSSACDLPAWLCGRSSGAFAESAPEPRTVQGGRVLSCSVGHDGNRSVMGDPACLLCCFCLFVQDFFFFNDT